jgi:hypothetical protein
VFTQIRLIQTRRSTVLQRDGSSGSISVDFERLPWDIQAVNLAWCFGHRACTVRQRLRRDCRSQFAMLRGQSSMWLSPCSLFGIELSLLLVLVIVRSVVDVIDSGDMVVGRALEHDMSIVSASSTAKLAIRVTLIIVRICHSSVRTGGVQAVVSRPPHWQ